MIIEVVKKYLLSSSITFVTAFALTLVSALQSGAITTENVSTATIFAVIMAAARAAFKAITEKVVLPAAGWAGSKVKAAFSPSFPLEK